MQNCKVAPQLFTAKSQLLQDCMFLFWLQLLEVKQLGRPSAEGALGRSATRARRLVGYHVRPLHVHGSKAEKTAAGQRTNYV